jgi:hypothetical protein
MGAQCNNYLGKRTMISLVPPSAKTGGNFGCSMFASTLHKMVKTGRLDAKIEHMRATLVPLWPTS